MENTKIETTEEVSECCAAPFVENSDFCSKCKEHSCPRQKHCKRCNYPLSVLNSCKLDDLDVCQRCYDKTKEMDK